MNKYAFLTELRARLWPLPEEDAKRSVEYYSEMIDDRMEDGLTEEEAVAAIGSIDDVVNTILATGATVRPAVQSGKPPRRLRWWEILLLILGFPVWGSLVISVAAVIFSLWISLWSVVISIYATSVALGVSTLGCIFGSFFMFDVPGTTFVALGAALICAGLAILFFLLGNLTAKGMIQLTKLTLKGIKGIFIRKEQSV